MISRSIIADDKHQELNISFTFQQQEDKLLINALLNRINYQAICLSHPDIDFDDIKEYLIEKKYNFVFESPEILKLKVGLVKLDFKNLEKMALIDLREKVDFLNDQLNQQSAKKRLLEKSIQELRTEMDLMLTKMGDLSLKCDDYQKQVIDLNKRLQQYQYRMSIIQKEKNDIKSQLALQKENVKNIQTQNLDITNEIILNRQHFVKQEATNDSLNQKITQLQTRINLLEEGKKTQQNKIQIMENQSQQQTVKINEKNALIQSLTKDFKYLQKSIEEQKRKEEELRLKQAEEERKRKEEELRLKKEQEQIVIVKKQNKCYKFSKKTKSQNITIDENDMRVDSYDWGQDILQLVEGAVFKKGSVLRFKVIQVGESVGFGLGLRKVIEGNRYSLKDADKIGHGCFLLKKNGQALSHSSKENNCLMTGFKFGNGDVVEVETNEKELLVREKTGKWKFTMDIQLSDDDWHQACFCVYLRGNS